MKIHNIIIVTLTISMVVLGSQFFLSSLSDNYSQEIDYTGLNRTLERLNYTQTQSESIRKNINDMVLSDSLLLDVPYKMIQVGWTVLKLTFGSIWTVTDIIADSFKIFEETGIPLPAWLQGTIIAILIVMIAFILVYGFYKWKFED